MYYIEIGILHYNGTQKSTLTCFSYTKSRVVVYADKHVNMHIL